MKINKRFLQPQEEFSWKGNSAKTLVFHTTWGYTLEGAVETLRARHLSYHFIIEDGEVYQLIDINRSAWHAGVKDRPTLKARVLYGDENPNKHSLAIAFVYKWQAKLSVKDITAAVQLIKYLGQETGIRYTVNESITHNEITRHKPTVVNTYRDQVMEALVGYKDNKDGVEKTTTHLMIEYLMLQVAFLKLKLKFL